MTILIPKKQHDKLIELGYEHEIDCLYEKQIEKDGYYCSINLWIEGEIYRKIYIINTNGFKVATSGDIYLLYIQLKVMEYALNIMEKDLKELEQLEN